MFDFYLGLWNAVCNKNPKVTRQHASLQLLWCVKDWVRNGPSLRYVKKKF